MPKTNATILIIDDDEDILLSAKLLLKKHYTNIITRDTPKELNQILSSESVDVIILDMNYRIGFNDEFIVIHSALYAVCNVPVNHLVLTLMGSSHRLSFLNSVYRLKPCFAPWVCFSHYSCCPSWEECQFWTTDWLAIFWLGEKRANLIRPVFLPLGIISRLLWIKNVSKDKSMPITIVVYLCLPLWLKILNY